jgi:Glutamate decarboxylase and related PLP-dependent proteins
MNTARKTLLEMFDAEVFRVSGHALIDLLAQELQDSLNARRPVLQWREPTTEDNHWQQPLPQQPSVDLNGLLEKLKLDILPGNLAIHHPRNLGHQVATPLPVAALCDLVASLTNQAMAVYETGPTATMLERQVLRWLSALIGWQSAAVNGVLTSGGAQANLTALLAARQHAGENRIWRHGVTAERRLRIIASEHSHYSIARAAGIMGLGTEAVVTIATDVDGRMRPDAIAEAHEACRQDGEIVMAVVANAACTPTGSVDPLRAIGEYCAAHHLWLHVDGAHGASALLSNRHSSMLDGIALADSVTWDGHKLLYMPATVSAVLFRSADKGRLAFAQDASYLFQDKPQEEQDFNVSYRTLECTKRMMALKLWAAFSLYGVEGMALLVDEAFDKARRFAAMIAAAVDFELLMQPQTNIVCFRHLAAGINASELNRHQAEVRKGLVESGGFHLTQVELHGTLWLRTTLMNPFTQEEDLQALLDAVRAQPASSAP